MWFKALFTKFWFAGAVFYFIGWGGFIQSADALDLTFVLGLVHGLVTDIVVNRILVFMETDRNPTRKFMFCYSKRFFSLPVNLILGVACAFLVAHTYSIANQIAIQAGVRPEGYIAFGAEPIVYGLLYLIYDMVFVVMKNTFVKVYKKAKQT
jgi:putative flippase GtrA